MAWVLVYPDSLDLRLRNSGNPKLANSRFVSFIDKVSKATAAHCRERVHCLKRVNRC